MLTCIGGLSTTTNFLMIWFTAPNATASCAIEMAWCQIFGGIIISTIPTHQKDCGSVPWGDMIKQGTMTARDMWLMFQAGRGTTTGTSPGGYIKGCTEADLDNFMLKVDKCHKNAIWQLPKCRNDASTHSSQHCNHVPAAAPSRR